MRQRSGKRWDNGFSFCVTGVLVGLVSASLAFTTAGCASVGEAKYGHHIIDILVFSRSSDAPEDYSAAGALLEAGDHANALLGFEAFLRREPTSAWTQAAVFNTGRALEGLERWSEAAERYRSVIRATEGRAPKLQANALYRISFCHEALHQDNQVVAALSDAEKRQASLDKEIAEAELPARLASAYARVGNHVQADAYYRKADAGIVQLRRDPTRRRLPHWLPRTLYDMGAMSLRSASWDDFETSLRPLMRAQGYLLQAAELGVEPWSDRAGEDLAGVYRNLWSVIESAPLPSISDPLLGRRQVQERQWDRAALLAEHLQALRAYRTPPESGGEESRQAKGIFEMVEELEGKIRRLYLERPAGEGLTLESIARRNKLRGQVVTPDDRLERHYLERDRAVGAAPAEKPTEPTLPATQIPDGTRVPMEDPNL